QRITSASPTLATLPGRRKSVPAVAAQCPPSPASDESSARDLSPDRYNQTVRVLMHTTLHTRMLSDIDPTQVVPTLRKHILVDGFQLVVDLQRSHGSRFADAATGRTLLDLYGFYASM